MSQKISSFIHSALLSVLSKDIIVSVTGWDVDHNWRVSSRDWTFLNMSDESKAKGLVGKKQVTVFNRGKKAVVFLDEKLFSYTSSYKSSDFDAPSKFASRTKYKFFSDHIHHINHCRSCV